MSPRSSVIIRSWPFIAALVVAATVAGAADQPVRRRAAATHPVVQLPQAPAAGSDRGALLSDLVAARRSGDAAAAEALLDRLEREDGSPNGASPTVRRSAAGTVVFGAGKAGSPDKWQGDDVLVAGTPDDETYPCIVGDASGNLYAAVEVRSYTSGAPYSITVHRSTDGGESWSPWFTLADTEAYFTAPALAVGSGLRNWLFVAYVRDFAAIDVFRIDLDDPGTYDTTTVETGTLGMANPCLTTDSAEFGVGWYVYLAYNAMGADAWELHSCTTVDMGTSWYAPVTLHAYCGLTGDPYDGNMGAPDIDYGNQKLYVAFDDYPAGCDGAQRDVYVLRSDDYGGSWVGPAALAASPDDEYAPSVAAAKNSDPATVLVAYTVVRQYETLQDVDYAYSFDGAGWSVGWYLSAYSNMDEFQVDLAVSSTGGRFHAAFVMNNYSIWYGSTAFDDPDGLQWSGQPISYYSPEWLNWTWIPSIAVNPTLAPTSEAAIVWVDERSVGVNGYDVYFDGPNTVGLGTVAVDVAPDGADSAWHIENFMTGWSMDGSGDVLLTDMDEGDYILTWEEAADWTPQCQSPETLNLSEGNTITFACEYARIHPRLTEVSDVGNDQGRQLRLVWDRSGYDAPGIGDDVTGYEVYRRRDAAKASANADKLAGWDWLVWMPAHGDGAYEYVAPSLCDSTADGGVCWTVYMIRAATSDPFTFFESDPDSGYSIDNLAPSAPALLVLAGGTLRWQECPEADFDYFTIYGSSAPALDGGAEVIARTTGTSLDVRGDGHAYLLVTATDFAGNEGEAAVAEGPTAAPGIPAAFRLLGAAPNPFNPATTIRFELPKATTVDLRLYDAAGRLVRVLARDEHREAGSHGITWDGRDAAGRYAPAGVYVYRLHAGDAEATGRMLLVK